MSHSSQYPVRYAPLSVPHTASGPQPGFAPSGRPQEHHRWTAAPYGYLEQPSIYGNFTNHNVSQPADTQYSWQPTPITSQTSSYPVIPALSSTRESNSVAARHQNVAPSQVHPALQPCLWGPCGIMLDDHRSGGMMRHLTEHHEDAIPCGNASSAGGGQSNAACALVCQWTLNGEPCPSAHVYHTVRTLARHISSRHLGVGRATCEFCEIEFSRKDALRRHQTATCPRHPGYSGGQSGGPLRRTRRRHCKANATRTTQDARV